MRRKRRKHADDELAASSFHWPAPCDAAEKERTNRSGSRLATKSPTHELPTVTMNTSATATANTNRSQSRRFALTETEIEAGAGAGTERGEEDEEIQRRQSCSFANIVEPLDCIASPPFPTGGSCSHSILSKRLKLSGCCKTLALQANSIRLELIVCVLLLLLSSLVSLLGCSPSASNSSLACSDDPNSSSNSSQYQSAATRLARTAAIGEQDESASRAAITVSTKHGLFRGLILSNQLSWQRPADRVDVKVVGFLGIRYASAPVKRLRFMPPTPYNYAANQLHDSTKFGPICMQRWPVDLSPQTKNHSWSSYSSTSTATATATASAAKTTATSSSEEPVAESVADELLAKTMPSTAFHYLRPLFRRLIAREQSEDCLNLNIYVPLSGLQRGAGQTERSRLPVLVIIHGESFDYGAGSAYDGHRLLLEAGGGGSSGGAHMLVVTFNYRLNIFGFLPKLAAASRGNLGLMDQIAALHWIKDNIGSFGGSAGNITLMGTKRGALFVNLLMLSPLAKGLFQRAVMEDGSALSPITANQVAPPAHHQNTNSVQYLRILAKLCDCPAVRSSQSAGGSSSSSRGAGNSDPADEQKANAQMLECLRYKPAEQVAQRVPLAELLHLDPMASSSSSTGAATVRPIFGPLIDGSIVPDEDFATSMLKEDSSLAQRDLLLGLTRPVLFAGLTSKSRQDVSPMIMLGADNYLSERISASQETQGLSNEHAMSLVNAFVRSFYRYHNQEIANSILNHYLSLAASNLWQQAAGAKTASASSPSERTEDAETATARSQRGRQEFLLGSIARLFQDSLTDVPLLKLALIHSVKQMDPLLNAHVDNLFDRWRGLQTNERHLAGPGEQEMLANFGPQLSASDFERKSLLDSFTAFARQQLDYDDRGRSPEWRHLAVGPQTPTKSTYLYQLDASSCGAFSRRIESAIERIMAREKAAEQKNIWRMIGPIFGDLASQLKRISTVQWQQWASLECAHYPHQSGNTSGDGDDDGDEDSSIADRLLDWFCLRRTRKILAGFVIAGNVNSGDADDDATTTTSGSLLDDNLVNLEDKCFNKRQTTTTNNRDVGANQQNGQLSVECRRHLETIALTVLTNELQSATGVAENDDGGGQWKNFNIFSQQVATLLVAGSENPTKLWRMDRISDSGGNEPAAGLLSKSSFWSNFIPALNCNKTQPITPSALLDNGGNSSMISLSLQFSCQHGPRTAQDYVEYLVSVGAQRLQARKSQWRQVRLSQQQSRAASSSSSNQNHHTLRMANMSQSGSPEDNLDSSSSSSSAANDNANNNSPLNETFELTAYDYGSRAAADLRSSRTTGFVLVLCCLIIGVTLISGLYVAAKQQQQRCFGRKKSLQRKPTSSPEAQSLDANNAPDSSRQQDTSFQLINDQNVSDQQSGADAKAEWIPARAGSTQTAAISSSAADWQLRNSASIVFEDEQQQFHESQSFLAKERGAGVCRSHSASSFVPTDSLNGFVNGLNVDQLASQTFGAFGLGEEPIVLPILSNNQHQHEFRCSTLDGATNHARRPRNAHNYLASFDQPSTSTETQNGRGSSQSSAATTTATAAKKRVKISEPQSIMKATRQYLDNDTYQQHPGRTNHHQSRYSANQPRVQLCPIHSRSQSSQYLTAAHLVDTTGQQQYISINNGSSNEYLNIINPQAWTGVADQTMGYSANNCDPCL